MVWLLPAVAEAEEAVQLPLLVEAEVAPLPLLVAEEARFPPPAEALLPLLVEAAAEAAPLPLPPLVAEEARPLRRVPAGLPSAPQEGLGWAQ